MAHDINTTLYFLTNTSDTIVFNKEYLYEAIQYIWNYSVPVIGFIWYFFVRDNEKFLSGRWEGNLTIVNSDNANLKCEAYFTKHKGLPLKGIVYYNGSKNNMQKSGIDVLNGNKSTIERIRPNKEFTLDFINKIHLSEETVDFSDTHYLWNVIIKKEFKFFKWLGHNRDEKYSMQIDAIMPGSGLHFNGTLTKTP